MLYAAVRSIVGFALRLFYRIRVNGTAEGLDGPVMFVGNHPNALIDPALIFVITRRHVTFLAKEPLFRMPILGWLIKGLGALPVFRKQDNPAQMQKNEGTFEAASGALVQGRAITLFPEGKSHSEPALAELKTGAARIAFRAGRQGAAVKVVPVGLTYSEKHRFRSEVLIEVGEPIEVLPFLPVQPEGEPEAVRALTERITAGLQKVMLSMERWEDLPLIETAEALYAFRLGDAARDPERLRRFARGAQLLRAEKPERFEEVRGELMAYRHRLQLVRANPEDLTLVYRRGPVYSFAVRNLAAVLLGFPLFALGVLLFAVPFYIPRWINRALKVELDQQATVKLLSVLVLAPLVMAGLFVAGWLRVSLGIGLLALAGSLPLAVFTRVFLERWRSVWRDVQVFFILGSRAKLKARLLVDGEQLSAQVEALAKDLGPRVSQPSVRAG